MNEISFSYERIGTKTRFENEAIVNLEMAFSVELQEIDNFRILCRARYKHKNAFSNVAYAQGWLGFNFISDY